MTEAAENEDIAKLPEKIRNAIKVQRARAADAQSLIDLGLARVEETPGFTRKEEQSPLPDRKTITVQASNRGFDRGSGFEWEIDYKQDWSGSLELRAHKFTRIPGQSGENYYQVVVTRSESPTEFPHEGVTVTVPIGSYYYEEIGSGTDYIRGRNDPQIIENINAFFASLNEANH